MATVNLAPRALAKFYGITEYLIEMSPDAHAPEKFAQLIRTALDDLADNPFRAGISSIDGAYRELTIKANRTRSYRLLYKYEQHNNHVTVLGIKDSREQGYEGYF